MKNKKEATIEKRKNQDKEILTEQLRKTPIIQIACEKCGVSRATFYRWRSEDLDFAAKTDTAINEGLSLITDMAESQLISAIKDRNLPGIIFWLKAHHKDYKTKLELSGKIEVDNRILTPEQQELIERAMKLAGLNQKPYEK
ncbi:MAG: phBC6A51 family helix-turn-helix protein [Candidatus Paceibacterota bacterium]|jgi:hypothetical protein